MPPAELILFLRLRWRYNEILVMTAEMAATAPTTPPAIAPAFERPRVSASAGETVGLAVGMGALSPAEELLNAIRFINTVANKMSYVERLTS